jgi:hypothetical protein
MSRRFPPRVAIGVRPRTGWAMLVAVADPQAPRALFRRRVDLLGDDERFVFHHASELGSLEAAAAHIEAIREKTIDLARHALDAARAETGEDAVAFGVIAAPPKPSPPLASILKVHMKIHGAEGVFYPEAWLAAAYGAVRISEKEMALTVADRCEVDEAEVVETLKAMGQPLGPPWDADCKLAAGAAWAALGS